MQAGKLRHRVIIERPDIARDDTGTELITWVAVDTVWASIRPLELSRGNEGERSAQVQAPLDTIITLRWTPRLDGMTARWRLREVFRSNPVTYNLAAPPVQINKQHREIRLTCRSGVDEGQ